MKQINNTVRVMSRTAKASATRLLNIGSKVGCVVNETVVDTSGKVISQVGIVKGKLPKPESETDKTDYPSQQL